MLSLRGRLEVGIDRSAKRDYEHNGISRKEVRSVVEFIMLRLTDKERYYLFDHICDELGMEDDYLIFDKEKLTIEEEKRICGIYPIVVKTLNTLGHERDPRFI